MITDAILNICNRRPTEQELTTPRFVPSDFDGDTSAEALEAWAVYQSLPDNFDATHEQSVQDAFTAAFDLGKKAHA